MTLKYKFKQWIELEEIKGYIFRAAEETRVEFPELVFDFLSAALFLDKKELATQKWSDVLGMFADVCKDLVPDQDIPILHAPKGNGAKEAWEYRGRTWYFYANKFAEKYGWELEYSADLSVKDALGLIQEMLVDEQLDREFQWGMSEASVTYDKLSQQTRPNPLPRPYFMAQAKEKDLPVQKIKIPKNLLPIGSVNYDAVPDDFKPQDPQSK